MTRLGFALTSALLLALPVSAQAQDLPRCSESLAATDLSNPFLDSDGYPLMRHIAQQTLEATSTPCLDTYVFTVGDRVVVAPNARITYTGLWRQVQRRRVSTEDTSPSEMHYSESRSVSVETSREIGASLALGMTGGVKPLGIGAEATVEAAVSFSTSLSEGRESGQEFGFSTEVHPGEEAVIWAREIHVHVEWEPEFAYPASQPFQGPRDFIDMTYLPSQREELMRTGVHTTFTADATINAMRLPYAFNVPLSSGIDAQNHVRAIQLLGEFRRVYGNGLTADYTLPLPEYTATRYTFGEQG